VTILLYGFASVTVLQRMYEDRHWLSDTVLGSVIGISSATRLFLFTGNTAHINGNHLFSCIPFFRLNVQEWV